MHEYIRISKHIDNINKQNARFGWGYYIAAKGRVSLLFAPGNIDGG